MSEKKVSRTSIPTNVFRSLKTVDQERYIDEPQEYCTDDRRLYTLYVLSYEDTGSTDVRRRPGRNSERTNYNLVSEDYFYTLNDYVLLLLLYPLRVFVLQLTLLV